MMGNSNENFYDKHKWFINSICLALVTITVVVMALFSVAVLADDLGVEVVAQSSTLFDLLAVLIGSEKATQWITAIGLICFVLTHIRAWIPATWLAKLPSWISPIIESLAGNYRGAKNNDKNSDSGANNVS